MQWHLKTFSELTAMEFYKIAQARAQIFVVEQECAYLDIDDTDLTAHHLWLSEGEQLQAYGRIYQKRGAAMFGRVIVSQAYRGQGLGSILLERLIKETSALYPEQPILIGAQAHLQQFYGQAGFTAVSAEYLEDGIPHIKMQRLPE